MWFNSIHKIYGIDLGTSNTVIFESGKGVVLSEPSVVAYREGDGEVVAVGAQAQAMIGRTPESVGIHYPLRDGVIANYEMAGKLLEHLMKKLRGRISLLRHAQVYISAPCGITEVQKRAVEETVIHKGAKRAYVVEGPLAAAIGAGLPIHEPIGHLVLDIGGGTSQVAIVSMGGIVTSHTLRRGSLAIDREIQEYAKRKHNLDIGERTAEEIKMSIASACATAEERSLDIRGRDLIDGLPRSMRLVSGEVAPIVEDFLKSLIEAIRTTMELCPPELAGDVVEQGIMLCGGGSLMEGLGERIRQEIGVPVHLADRPLECTAIGSGKMQS